MNTLFGIPIATMAYVCIMGFGGVVLAVALLNLHRPIVARIALRNVIRRVPQSMLMVAGLALSTILITNAMGVGDTLAYSARQTAIQQLGPVDIEITATGTDRYPMLLKQTVAPLLGTLSITDGVAGVVPIMRRDLSLVAPRTSQSDSAGSVLGVDATYEQSFGAFTGEDATAYAASSLGVDEVYLNQMGADTLLARPGDILQLYGSEQPTSVRVKAIIGNDGLSTKHPTVVMPLTQSQTLFSTPDAFSALAIKLHGDILADSAVSGQAMEHIGSSISGLPNVQVSDVKAQALTKADADGQLYMQIFMIMGTFAIIIGMLLIFLLFVMLAAERRSEMGMARAIGFQRRHLVLMFLTEGLVYQVIASLIGVLIGVALCRVMVQILAYAFEQVRDTSLARDLIFHFSATSLAISFGLGFLLTAMTVVFSAWRVSRANIIEAIRNLPAVETHQSWVKLIIQLVRALLLFLVGVAAVGGGYAGQASSLIFLGLSLALIGGSLMLAWVLARTPLRRTFSDRIAFSVGGVGLLLLWLLPNMNTVLGLNGFAQGPEVFVLSGVFIIFGAIWAVTYNLDLLLHGISSALGPVRRLVPILKLAIAYPLVSKLRTGLALAMFSLIIFTVVMVSAITSTQGVIYEDHDAFTGGYQIYGQVSGVNRIGDLRAAISRDSVLAASDFETISTVTQRPITIQYGNAQEQTISSLFAMDESYFARASQRMRFKMRSPAYVNDVAIWQALHTRNDVVVLTRLNVRSNTSPNTNPGGAYVVEGNSYIEDSQLPPLWLDMHLSGGITTKRVEVIGVLDTYGLPMNGLYTNQATLHALAGNDLAPTAYMINTRANADSVALARNLEQAFVRDGLTTIAIDPQLDALQEGDRLVFKLFKVFLTMGLVIGIAALGVISSRNVVERRQQVGMLRAIGYQRSQIQHLFLIESGFIALLGLLLGALLGLILGANVTAEIAKSQPGVVFDPEWAQLLLIVCGAFAFSLLATYLPAQRAARTYPAEALRYE